MKNYTNHFDSGFTHLTGGECVRKDEPRVEAYGNVDELNSVIGLARSFIKDREICAILKEIQQDMLVVGADLASDPQHKIKPERSTLTAGRVARMEELMQRFEQELPPLTNFILPAGGPGASMLHVARTVCRRVERRIVQATTEEVSLDILKYFNRLSDLLFTLARAVNRRESQPEEVWK